MSSSFTDHTALVRTSVAGIERQVLSLGALSIALYALTWIVERALARNEVEAWPNILESPFAAPSVPLLLLHALTYVIATLVIFWCYVAVLSMCRTGELQGRARAWALAIPVLINLMLVPMVPRLSQDLFSYLAHGLLGVIPGGNPLTQPAEAVRDAVVGANLVEFGWHWDGEDVTSSVTVTLTAGGDGTTLVVEHDGLADSEVDNHAKGWSDCLDRLPDWLAARSGV